MRNKKLDREYNLIEPQFRDEKDMVQNVVDVIEDKCEYGRFPNEFGTLLREHTHAFSKAKNFVVQYINSNRLSIP